MHVRESGVHARLDVKPHRPKFTISNMQFAQHDNRLMLNKEQMKLGIYAVHKQTKTCKVGRYHKERSSWLYPDLA